MGRLTLLGAGYQPSTGGGGGHLYDFTTGSLPAGVTATGGANGTVLNASGDIAAATAPRFDYLGGTASLLAEPARTNALLNSDNPQTVSATAWRYDNCGTVTGSTINGIKYATVSEGTATAQHLMLGNSSNRPAVTTAQKFAGSCPLRAGTDQYIKVQFWFSSGYIGIIVDTVNWTIVSTQTLNSAVVDSAELIDYGNGNYWLHVVGNLNTDTSVILGACTLNNSTPTAGASNPSFAGTSRTLIWGNPQLEIGQTSCSTLIKTTTVAVTRTADVITLDTPATFTTMRLTYHDGTTEDFTVTPSSTFEIPTAAGRRVKYADPV